MSTQKPQLRRRLYTLLAVANRELAESRPGWSDDDYRLILRQCGAKDVNGTPSATTMSEQDMEKAMARFKQLGFRVRQNKGGAGWRAPRIAKLTAIWCTLADAGIVRDRSQRALENFLHRHVNGLTHLQWATTEQLNQCVEILKQWASRTKVSLDKDSGK